MTSQELARKRPATILSATRLPTVRDRALVATEKPIERGSAPRAWRPDLWPAYVWAPILMTPGAVLAYVLAHLGMWISHQL